MLHDIESIWWITLWFIFNTTPEGSMTIEGQQEQAASLFSRVARTHQRYLMIASVEHWNSCIKSIPQDYMPVAQGLNTIRMAYVEITNNTYHDLCSSTRWSRTADLQNHTESQQHRRVRQLVNLRLVLEVLAQNRCRDRV